MQPTEITVKDGRKLITYEFSINDKKFIELLKPFFIDPVTIIGTLHYNPEPVFDFDTEQFVEYTDVLMSIIGREYKEYSVKDCSIFPCMTANESFLSLLHSYGIGYKENPLGERPDENDIKKYPLPINFDPQGERRDLMRRRLRITDEFEAWRKAEEGVLRPDKQYVFIEVKP